MKNYWTKELLKELLKTTTFKEMGIVAIKVLNSMPNKVHIVSGPISTGGYGTLEKNLQVFEQTVNYLKQNHNTFDQIPMEESIHKLMILLGDKYDSAELLQGIYLPLFSSPKINNVHFINGWKSSQGAKWEHAKSLEFNKKITYLPKGFEIKD